jgi:hypothetical protein
MNIHYASLFSNTKDRPGVRSWNLVVKALLFLFLAVAVSYSYIKVQSEFLPSGSNIPVYSFEEAFDATKGDITKCVVQYGNYELRNRTPLFEQGKSWSVVCGPPGSLDSDKTKETAYRYKLLSDKPVYGTDQDVLQAMVDSGYANNLAIKYPQDDSQARRLAVVYWLLAAGVVSILAYLVYYHVIYRTILYAVLRLRKGQE